MTHTRDVPSRLVVTAAQLEIIDQILQRHIPDLEVWAFGSRIQGTTKKFADLDLVLISRQPLPRATLGSMSEDFAESDLPYRIDLVDWSSTDEHFRRRVEANYVILQQPMKTPTDPAGKALPPPLD